MEAVIIAVGDELLAGLIVDTNSPYLARRLGELGVPVIRHVTVGDDAGRIASAIGAAAGEAGLVLVTGGLGPTLDDVTRQGLAQAMGVELVEDTRQAERIAGFFASRGRELKPSNLTQAQVPAGAEAIDNECGTAPGMAARLGDSQVFVMPGPPAEATEMFEERIAPRLAGEAALVRREVHTFGAGESDIGEALADMMARGRNPTVGTAPMAGEVVVRITAMAPDRRQASAAAEKDVQEVRRRLGDLVFAADDDTLASVVAAALTSAGQTLAVAESCTGGMIGQMITATPGASQYFLGGVASYADSAKRDVLGVAAELIEQHGAVSEPVAAAMAQGARRRFGSHWALGVTGIAGPTGASAAKPVGLVYIAVAAPARGGAAGTEVHRHVFPGRREVIRRRAATAALNHLRLAMRPEK